MTDSQNVRSTWVRQGSSENSIAQGLKFILAILTTTMTLFCPNALAQPNVEWTVSYEHAAPQLDADPIQIENLGNGRYRAVVNALAADGQDVFVHYEIDAAGNPNPPAYQLFINRLVDGLTQDQYLEEDVPLIAVVDMGQTPSNRVFSLRLRASDGLDVYDVTRQFVSPASDPQLQFFIDVAGDGVFELAGGGQNYIEFTVDPGVGQTVVSGFVRHPDGAHADFDELVTLPNSVPNLEEARIITVDSDTFEVVLATSAIDSDDDDIVYEVDWGDGTQTTTPANIISHQYPAVYASYVVRVAALDGRGGRDSQNVGFEFTEPAGNTAPAVDYVTLLDQSGYEVIVAAAATDADGDPLTYTYDWGDGSPLDAGPGIIRSHTYPDLTVGPRLVTVEVSDGHGGTASGQLVVEFVAPAENTAPNMQAIHLIEQDAFNVVLGLQAVDPDGDQLTFLVDWGDGGQPEAVDTQFAAHQFPVDVFATYRVRVTAIDPDGASHHQETDVTFLAPAANQAPAIESMRVADINGFAVTMVTTATDPDDDPLTYRYDWGDGSPVDEVQGGTASHTYPDAFANYVATVTVSDGRGGSAAATQNIGFEAPAPNNEPVIDHAQVIATNEFSITVAVSATDADADPLEYSIDWGDGSAPTVNAAGVARHDYPVNVFESYDISVVARDPNGGSDSRILAVDFPEPQANEAPEIELAQFIRIDAFQVTLAIAAFDADDDPISYRVVWGDGTTTEQNSGVLEHTYPLEFRRYDVDVLIEDGRGGFASERLELVFEPPADNRAPQFTQAEILSQDGFLVVVGAHANDLDGDQVTYRFDWGDDSDVTTQGSGVAAHRFPERFEPFTITVTADDGRGGTASEDIDVRFVAPPDNQPPVLNFAQIVDQDGRRYTFAVAGTDPDGDELSYTFDWGDGSVPETTVGGVASHTYGDQIAGLLTARVLINDGRGGEIQTFFELFFEPPQPNEPPTFEILETIEIDGFNVKVAAHATDPDGDALTYEFDWGDDTDAVQQVGGVAAHAYPDLLGTTYTVTVRAFDGNGGEDTQTIEIEFPAPPENQPPVFDQVAILAEDGLRVTVSASAVDADDDPLTYTFDWNDDSPITTVAGGVTSHEFPAYGQYLVVVTADDGRGGLASAPILVQLDAPPANQPPTIESIQIVRNGDWGVQVFVGASDPEGEALSYAFDWGDGTPQSELNVGLADHNYPEDVFRAYQIRVTVSDPDGLETTEETGINFPHPAPNLAPRIDDIALEYEARGLVRIRVTAVDPEDGALAYSIHWGDEEDIGSTMDLPGGVGMHRYASAPDDMPYQGFVDVTDSLGETTRGVFVARVVDQPTRIRGVDVELIQEGLAALTVIAEDADGPELLLYSFDFDGDGAYEVENAVGERAIHRYQSPGDKRYVVRTLDTWSGTTTEQEGRFELPNWIPGNQPPTIDALTIDIGHGGVAELNVQASDADQDRLTYEVRWGDVEEGEFVEIANGNATHAYAYRESRRPYIGVARVTDGRGGVVDVPFDVAVQDEPTRIADVTVTPVGNGEYEVRVTADDLDSDALLFSYDFEGDGIYEIEASPTHVARHQYEAPANYRVSVRVSDPWSGQSVTTVTELTVDPWVVENRAPLIDGLAIETGHRGRVQLTIDAFDEDGHALSTFVRWGDEEDGGADTAFVGRNVVHNYAYRPAQRPYFGYVRVVDSEGAESRREFAVEVADTETELRVLTSERVREGTWLLSIEAMDPDAQDELEYSFDFDADGQWDLENTLNHQVVHTFGAVGRYPVGVRVRDPWSGRAVDAVYVVGDDRDGTPNLPPVIDSVAIDVAPGGEAKLRLDATDPEGGELEVTVFWGDSQFDVQERVVGFEASHVYPYPVDDRSYDGRLVVTDASGLETLYPFTVEITDRPTDVEQITMSVLRNGTVFVAVSATDPDSDGLEYAFDMNGDGLFEAAELQLGEFVYEYEGGGTYEVVVAVTDPWSGVTAEVEKVFVLEPWIRSAPFADDHLEGEEGRCLVLRVAQGRVTSESGPSVCEREQNPNAEDWRWDFGDGTVARGSEVGHVYARDGIYSVTVTGGTQSQPIESVIEVLIVNVAPDFITEPPEDAEGGETYFYTVELQDQGLEDEIQLELTQGPAGMNLTPLGGRKWQLSWDVPPLLDGSVEVELTATDGRTIDGAWREDGGRTIQRYRIDVVPMIIPDAAPPEPDAYIPSFRDIQGDRLGCASDPGQRAPWSLIILTAIVALAWRRQRGR